MSGWEILQEVWQFVRRNADITVQIKGSNEWRTVTNIKGAGYGLHFRVEGEEWDITMEELHAIDLRLNM